VTGVEILDPRAPAVDVTPVAAVDLDRGLETAPVVGLRLDRTWRSFETVVDAWEQHLERDGASTRRLLVGPRTGPAGERTQHAVDEWARLVDCGVVGLGN